MVDKTFIKQTVAGFFLTLLLAACIGYVSKLIYKLNKLPDPYRLEVIVDNGEFTLNEIRETYVDKKKDY